MPVLIENKQYLTFTLDTEKYAIGVNKVREVVTYSELTKIPKTEKYLRGIINLRGTGIPVMDLRIKFGLEESSITRDTSIIVLEVKGEENQETLLVGAMADSVQEVIDLLPEEIEPSPKFGSRISNNFVSGIGKKNENFLIILDIDKLVDTRELAESVQ